MNVTAFYGFICPNCKSTVDIGIGEPICPDCKTKMIPNEQGTSVAANVHCKNCDISFGLINSDKCPECGTPFE